MGHPARCKPIAAVVDLAVHVRGAILAGSVRSTLENVPGHYQVPWMYSWSR